MSAIILSLVILYAVTKDRWNWKRIALWGTLGPLAAAILASLIVYAAVTWDNRPRPVSSFYGIAVKAPEKDVRFLKGDPTRKSDDGVSWIYDIKDSVSGSDIASYIVRFKNGKVRYVLYAPSTGYDSSKEYLVGFSVGSGVVLVDQKLGKPSHVSQSSDGASLLQSYADYNVFFGFSKGNVDVYGIYDPETGPVIFGQ